MTLFLSNVLVGVRVVYLPDCLLILSLLKHRGVGDIFELKKMRNPNGKSPLNSSIDKGQKMRRKKKKTKTLGLVVLFYSKKKNLSLYFLYIIFILRI